PIRQVVAELLDAASRAGSVAIDPAERPALEAHINDAFERGAPSEAIAALLAKQRGSERSELRLGALVESALSALGVDPRRADASWSRLLRNARPSPLPGQIDLRRSPLHDAFSGVHMPIDDDTPARIAEHSFAVARLETSLGNALAAPDSLEALRALEK